jgi:hypothetical protein
MENAVLIRGDVATRRRRALRRYSGLAVSAGVMLLVLESDLATKALLITAPGAYHDRPAWTAAPVLVLALFIGWLARQGTWPLSVLAGGFLANGIDLLDGVGQNPFIAATGGGYAIAFNLADLAIMLAVAVTLWRFAGHVRRALVRA